MQDIIRKYWRDWYFLLIVFLVALAVRVVFVLQWQDTPYGLIPLLDARAYDDWAMDIVNGQWLRHIAFYQSPLYPYVLALLYAICGHTLLGAGLLNAVFGAATAVLLAYIARNLFGIIAAITTAALCSLYQPLIFYTAPVMKEPLGLFLLALHLVFALRILRDNRARIYLAAGVTLGLAVLGRGNVLMLLPIVPAFAFYIYRAAAFRGMCVYILAAIITILPATLHNAYVSNDFVPVTYADGFNLYIGHFPGANGINSYPPEVSTDPVQEETVTRYTAEQALGRNLVPSEVSSYWRGRAVDFMVKNPVEEVKLSFNKLGAFWSNAQPFDNYDIGFIGTNFGTLIAHPLFEFWILAVLATFTVVAGIQLRRTDMVAEKIMPGALMLAYVFVYMCSVIIFYVADRYRLPVVMFLIPLAGAATPLIQYLIQHRLVKAGAYSAIVAAMMMLVTLRPLPVVTDLTAFNWGTLVTIYADLGNDKKTLEALDKAIAIAPDQIGAQAFIRGATAEDRLGHPDRARNWLETALTLYPGDGIAWYNVGRMHAANGNLTLALENLKRARELTPTYMLTYYALAKIYQKQGELEAARVAVQDGLAINPHDVRLRTLEEQLLQ